MAIYDFTATNLTVAPPYIGAAKFSGGASSPSGWNPAGYWDEFIAQQTACFPTSLTVAPPELGAPAFTQKHVFVGLGLTVAPPALDTPILHQTHVFVADTLSVAPPTFGSPAFTQKHIFAGLGLTVAPPALSAPTLTQKHVFIGLDLTVSPPTFGAPTLGFLYHFIANNLTVASPEFGEPAVEASVSPVLVNFVGLDLVVAGPRLGDEQPTIEIALRSSLDDDGAPLQEMYLSNYNDQFSLSCESNTLVGRTSPGRGPAQQISVCPPIRLQEGRLFLDSELKAPFDDRLMALEARMNAQRASIARTRWIG